MESPTPVPARSSAAEPATAEGAATLRARRCEACAPGTPALTSAEVSRLLASVPAWQLADREIRRTFAFEDFHETMAFVNAVAWVAHQEDHHPDLEVHYNRCVVRYSTHAVGGLSMNDFVCAAKVDALVE